MYARGNVSILVMFIMIATSLMGLLAMHFVQQMMEYSGVVHDYYKTYYLTKAGIEIGLTESNIRGIWFSTQISSWFFAKNMICGDRCKVDTQVMGSTPIARELFRNELTECNLSNAFHFKKWDNLMLPLFSEQIFQTQKKNLEQLDSSKGAENWSKYLALSKDTIEKIEIQKISDNNNFKANMGILAIKKNNDWTLGEFNTDITYFQKISFWEDSIKEFLKRFSEIYTDSTIFTQNFFYLLIGNASDSEVVFCVSTPKNQFSSNAKKLPTQRFWIESIAKFDDTKMSMEALYKQAIPSFFANAGGLE